MLFVFAFLFIITLFGFNVNSANAANCAPGDLYDSRTGARCRTSTDTPQIPPIPTSLTNIIEITARATGGYVNATSNIKEAITRLKNLGGGTLFFPPGKYIVDQTIEIPSNITIQGVGAGEVGPTMIILGNQGDMNATGMALLSISSGAKNVVIKDVELRSMTPGPHVYPRYDVNRINTENTTAIRIAGNANNIQFENLRIINFTYGIDAGANSGNPVIENVKIKNVASNANYWGLRVRSLNATKWDVQNLNLVEMVREQNGVLLDRSGEMAFLQLSCASTLHDAELCLQIGKRSGSLHFTQAHSEGPREGLKIKDSSTHPIYFENSALGGVVEAKNVIYSFANRSSLDEPRWRLNFSGSGSLSTLYACGDVFQNGYPNPTERYPADPYPGLASIPSDCNFDVTKIKNSHATGSLSFPLFNWLTTSSNSNAKILNVKSFGAKGDGVTDDTAAFRRAMQDSQSIMWSASTILVPSGRYKITDTLKLEDGITFRGESGSVIEFNATNRPLFLIHALRSDTIIKRGIVISNLSMTSRSSSGQTTAIEFKGDSGVTGDSIFSDLNISGFNRGIHAHGQPQLDSFALRNITLTSNSIGMDLNDDNISNWNLENIKILGMKAGQKGIVLDRGGLSIRGLYCEGESSLDSGRADACMTASRIGGLRIENLTSKNMKYAFYAPWAIGWTPYPVMIKNSDLRDGFYVAGKIYLLSVSNIYPNPYNRQLRPLGTRSIYFNTSGSDDPMNIYPGNESRVTSCGDSFLGSPKVSELLGLKNKITVCNSTGVIPILEQQAGSLSIAQSNSSLQVGTSATLQALYQPPMPTCATGLACAQVMPSPYVVQAIWTSSNPKIASVGYKDACAADTQCLIYRPDYQTASVTGISEGTTTITASYKDTTGSVTASTAVTVGQNVTGLKNTTKVLGAESFRFTQVLRLGSKGNEVLELQKFLNNAGYDTGIVDGNFGLKTKAAVITFQLANGLDGDGVVGPLTVALLNK